MQYTNKEIMQAVREYSPGRSARSREATEAHTKGEITMYRDKYRNDPRRMKDGLYLTRYGAEQDRYGGYVVVKVDAGDGQTGYRHMTIDNYNIWKMQR